MAKVRVCIAPRLVKYELLKEFQENKKQTFPSDYLAIYQKSDKQDDSWETIYEIWVYKQVCWCPVRWDENLDELLDFLKRFNNKRKPRHVQIINADD